MTAPQHHHPIVAALIRRGQEILLVQQQGPGDPAPSWVLPGGRVEPGELLPEALVREVREETGLEVLDPGQLLYIAQHYQPTPYHWSGEATSDVGALSTAFIFEVAAWRGDLRPADPDALIITCRFLPLAEAIDKLGQIRWRPMSEPILACLRGEAAPGAVWCYRQQADGSDQLVSRLG